MTSTGRVVAAAAFAVASTLALPAAAQWYGSPYYAPAEPYSYNRPPPVFRGDSRPLPPVLIVERLEQQGYEAVGRPRFNGSVYEIDATTSGGRRIRIVVDAFRGNVVERFALGRALEDDASGEPRGWFGNNVRPPDPTAPRRYSARPREEDEDGPDTFERLSREPSADRPPPRSRTETAPLPSRPSEAARPSMGPRTRESARPPAPERQAARPEPVSPSVDGKPAPGQVDGVNPDGAKPAATKPAARTTPSRNERASKPEPNRAFETAHTEPAPAAKPAEAPAPAITPEVPAPIVTPQAKAAPAEKPAATAEVQRPNKPVRVIQGVTPVYPEGKDAKPD